VKIIRACFGGVSRNPPAAHVIQAQPRADPPARPVPDTGSWISAAGRPAKRSIDDSFERKTADQKIAWLLEASPELRGEQYHSSSKIKAGARLMTDKEALCYALEVALESSRGMVPLICTRLLQAFPAETIRFPIFGIEFERSRLTEWSTVGVAPSHPSASGGVVSPEMQGLAAAMGNTGVQNVHAPTVVIGIADQLMKIRTRIDGSKKVTQREAEAEIAAYLKAQHATPDALAGFAVVAAREDVISSFDESNKTCLGILWNYIRLVSDPSLQALLKASMLTKFVEIQRERPCGLGMIERLIDIPSGIDLSLAQAISLADVRFELQTLAGKVNVDLEQEAAEYIAMVRQEVGQNHITGDPDAVFASMKRERFLQTAQVEFCLLRGINRSVIKAEADRIFPEGTIL
jgi:hypothetical protein